MTTEEYSKNYIFVYTDRKMKATFILIFFGMAQIMRTKTKKKIEERFLVLERTLPKTK